MKTRLMVTAACVLAVVTAALAQSGGAASDPVSGKWGTDGLPYLELQFDGQRTVSGTTIWRHGSDQEQRAAINTGTYIRDTRAVKLTGEVKNRDGETVPYRIEGTIDKDVMTGTYNVGSDKGDFRFTRFSANER